MKKYIILALCYALLGVVNANAREYPKVSHCDVDETYTETCYGEDNKPLNGWAVEGNQPESAGKQRRKIRKLLRAKKRGNGDTEQLDQELNTAMQTYTLSKFREGKKSGISREIDAYGFAVKSTEYSKGKKDGEYVAHYPDHHIQVKAAYKDGVLDGKVTFFNHRGRKIGYARYRRGILLKGYCRNNEGERVAMPTDEKTIATEVTPCPETSDAD